MRGVLGERREQLAHDRDARTDEDHVQDDVGDEHPIPCDVCVPTGFAPLLSMPRRGHELQDGDKGQERHGVEQEENGEGARVGRARDGARDERAECEPDVHRHPLLGEGCVTTLGRCQ